MTEKATKMDSSGSGELQCSIDSGLCPKCQTPSVIEDTGDLGQCQSCGLYMGNNLKSEILETRQTVLQSDDVFNTQNDLV